MPKQYNHLLSAALEHPWALTRPMVAVVANILARHLAGMPAAADPNFVTRSTSSPSTTAGAVAILPMHGVLAPRVNLMSDISGGATYEEATQQLREAVANPAVSTIVLDWDSPGGSVAGASELAREVLKARATKPIISQANYQMCSAAYWVGACATEIVAAPSAMIGSIGVYSIHEDLSKALDEAGIKLTYISAGKFKVDGNETGPLSDTARARIQTHVDDAYARFVSDVAKGRGITDAAIRSGYGEGASVTSEEALSLGLIDRIATLDDTVMRVLGSTPTPLLSRAEDATPPPVVTPHEPAQATGHERRRERVSIERALLELDF